MNITRSSTLDMIVLSACLAAISLPSATADEVSSAVQTAIRNVAPSVVRIRTIGSPGAADLEVSSSVTTGVVISEQREILTSVFGFTSQPAGIFVEDLEGNRVSAEIVATDHVRKLVLLKCREGAFQPAAMAQELWPAVGAWSVALGRLFPATQPSVSVGIVSAINRIHGLAIQTDAKISPVNYGGPLVNLDGRVMGILVPLSPSDTGEQIRAGVEWYDSGIGFAIPIADAVQSADVLRSGIDRVRGVIGIRPSTKNPLQQSFHVDVVFPKSPAATAGIQENDVLVAANGIELKRFGIFDSLVRSSYAGDKLTLTLKRNDEELNVELTLTDKLERPQPGFLGLITGKANGDPGDEDFGVEVYPFENSPASQAGLPARAIITAWDGEKLDSADSLQSKLRTLVADTELRLSYRNKADEAAGEQEITIQAVNKPDTVLGPTKAVEEYVADGFSDVEWTRQEKEVGEMGKVWFYAPEVREGHSSGLIVLLSESETPAEVTLAKWESVCRRYNLILIVPQNKEGTGLSREDAALLPRAFATAVPGRGIEISRSILVAREAQRELCSDMLLNPRLRQIKSAAFIETWPGVSGIPSEVLAAKSPSVILFEGTVQSRQALALQEQSIRQLNEAGAWVIKRPVAVESEISLEEQIAVWSLNLRAR